MLVTTAVCSFLLGIAFTLLVIYLLAKIKLRWLPEESIPHVPQFTPFKLPKELKQLLLDPNQLSKEEDCLYLNLLFQFLFKELKDSKRVRRWAVKKMNVEFAEMLQTTTGKLIDQISVRDFNMGNSFPVLNSVAVRKAKMEQDDHLEELDLELDIDYSGGFQLAVDIDLVFGKWAYLCLTVTSLKGKGRLQLSQQPYTHWSFAFYEEPQISLSIDSKYGGKSLPQITSLVVTQIKRSVRKKHVLPNYKMRFGPFFDRPEKFKMAEKLSVHGNRIGEGQLQVTIVECSRLTNVPPDSKLYCTLSIDSMQWLERIDLNKKVWVVHDIEIVTMPSASVGLNLREDFLLEKYEDVVVVDSLVPKSPAAQSDIRKGDILVSVGTSRVTSSKQAKKLIKNAGERFTVRIERPKSRGKQTQDVQLMEETFLSLDDQCIKGNSDRKDDFVHISFKCNEADDKKIQFGTRDTTEKQGPTAVRETGEKVSQKQGVMSLVNSGKALLQRKVKGQLEGEKGISAARDVDAKISKGFTQSQSVSSSPRKEVDPKSLRQRAHSDTSVIQVVDDVEEEVGSDGEEFADLDDESCDTHRTEEVADSSAPKWNEKFMLHVDREDRYLNVCVWCRTPEKLDKHDRVTKPGKEALLGHVSLPLPDICLDCLMTTQGDTQHTVPLVHAEPKAGASRAKFSNYASHKGFEPSLCYGDITLAFWHKPLKMSDEDRKKMTKIKREVRTQSPPPEVVQNVKDIEPENIKKIEEGRHDFTGTNFNTVTYCDFCGRKIWLKEAFQCYTCSMICHKKCMEKCQAQTLCTLTGAKMRDNHSQPWKPPITRAEAERRKAKEGGGQKSGGLLSKFRKDSSLERKQAAAASASPERLAVPQPSPQLSPQVSPQFLRRRNSAPAPDKDAGENEEKHTSSGSWQLSTPSLPHTRSTTSLQALTNSHSSSDMMYKEKESFDSSDESDGEMAAELQQRLAKMKKVKGHNNLDEMVVTAAKEMGKELFAELSLEERKEKLDNMVMKLQKEIDKESENKTELLKLEQGLTDQASKEGLQQQLSKSDEKVEALMMMMLHYCAGLQYCLDQESEDKQRAKAEQTVTMETIMDELVVIEPQKTDSSESEKEASMSDITQKNGTGLQVVARTDSSLSWSTEHYGEELQQKEPEFSVLENVMGSEVCPAEGSKEDSGGKLVFFNQNFGDEEFKTESSVLITCTSTSSDSLESDDDKEKGNKDDTMIADTENNVVKEDVDIGVPDDVEDKVI